ncbi:MAG TPA: hypothetical protein VFI03_07305 [Solirubrobacterales bacterium]|nr:hypothetical protein [Solirubrobacterales bacterium]
MSKIKQHITYANVASSIALFFVLTGGVALAASKISTKDIKAGAVKTKQLAKNSVKSGKIAPGAVKTSHIAPGAVGTSQLAPGAVGAAQLAANSVDSSKVVDGSLSPGDIIGGVATPVITATGGPVSVATGEEEEEEGEEEPGPSLIPLTGGNWTQGPQEHNIYLAQVDAVLASEEGEECSIEVTVNVDGESVGVVPAVLPEVGEEEEGEEEETPAPTAVTGGEVLGPRLATGAAQPRTLTASAVIGEDASCASAEVKTLQIVVIGIG